MLIRAAPPTAVDRVTSDQTLESGISDQTLESGTSNRIFEYRSYHPAAPMLAASLLDALGRLCPPTPLSAAIASPTSPV